MEHFFSHYGLIVAYILFGFTALAAFLMPIIFGNIKTLLRSLLGIGILVALFLIGYALSGNEVTLKYTAFGVSESGSKIIGGFLIMMYIMFGFALIGIIYNEVSRLLK